MGIYSETMSNTPVDTTFEETIIIDEVDPLAEFIDAQHYICSIFESKGYHAINIEMILLAPKQPILCLQMDKTDVNRFVNNMNRLGYTCTVHEAHKRRYRNITVDGEDIMELSYVYRHLDVIR